jgi:hypothetical protein
MNIQTREEYLEIAVEKLRPWFLKARLEIPKIKVACGFPSKNPLKTLGQCWSAECTPDGSRQIFISPINENAEVSVGVLCHELTHACLPNAAAHGKLFKDAMSLVGLEGKPVHAAPGPALQTFVEQVTFELGDYPNPTIKIPEKAKLDKPKNSFALFCGFLGCSIGHNFKVTVNRKTLALGFPVCPACANFLVMSPEDQLIYIMGKPTVQEDEQEEAA